MTTTNKSVGRPRLNKNDRKTMFSFRISPESLAKIRAIKERDKKTFSEIIENFIDGEQK